LIAQLPGFRSIVLDRPGWGPSSPIDFSKHAYGPLVAHVLQGVLDALELERTNAIGASIGDVWVLRLAEQQPTRVGRVVLLGGGPVVAEVGVPPFIRLLATPVGALMIRLPDKPERVRSILRRLGHGGSLDAGRIPDEFVDWRVTVARETDSMRHEREMVRAIVKGNSYRPGLTFDNDGLAAIQSPTLHVFGTADPTGSADIWQRVADILPSGKLHLIDGAGHMPWFDDPVQVAGVVSRFLMTGSADGGFDAAADTP
jgi:pimeloyl-ACP methyl ester carboxylesterase